MPIVRAPLFLAVLLGSAVAGCTGKNAEGTSHLEATGPCADLTLEADPALVTTEQNATIRITLENCGTTTLDVFDGGRCNASKSLTLQLWDNDTPYLMHERDPARAAAAGLYGFSCGPATFDPEPRVRLAPGARLTDEHSWNGTLLDADHCPAGEGAMTICARARHATVGQHPVTASFAADGKMLDSASVVVHVQT